MVEFNIRLADRVVAVSALYESTREFCFEYLTDAEADFSVCVELSDIMAEDKKSDEERAAEGLKPYKYSPTYLETLALYRKISEKMADFDTILFHGSAIMLDGEAYIFTAKSGTGKSTHTRLWREVFGERAVMINDDKPLIAFKEGVPTVYGTPWCGKHGLGKNIFAPVKAICILTRGEQNTIAKIPAPLAMPELFMQTYRFSDGERMKRVLATLDSLINSVGIYRLACNMNPDAALVAYEGMKG